jgi:hypothetical protein
VVILLLHRQPDNTMDVPSFPPEYVNASNAGRIVGLVGTFHFIALTFVSLRIYVRVFMTRAFGVDDGLIIVACVSFQGDLSFRVVYNLLTLEHK